MTTAPPTRIVRTTVAACEGSGFAQVRHDDRMVAIDADTAFGKLGARVDSHTFACHREPIVSPIPGNHLKGRDVRQRRRTGHRVVGDGFGTLPPIVRYLGAGLIVLTACCLL